jgi:glycerate kinase
MADGMQVLVAPAALGRNLRAPAAAAAIGRGLERAGVSPLPDLCPVAGGGRGTLEVLLPALGGETGDGFALIERGRTAIVELGVTARQTGQRVARAVDAGAEVVLVAAGGDGSGGSAGSCDEAGAAGSGGSAASGNDGGGAADTVEAIEEGGGLRGAALVVLCETRASWTGPADELRRDPRGTAMTAAGGGLAAALWARYDARLVPGAPFVLDELGFDARMRAARAVVVGDRRLDRATLGGRVSGEIAVRARQAGVPCHAVAAANALEPFDARILDLQAIVEATTIAELEAAGERLAGFL